MTKLESWLLTTWIFSHTIQMFSRILKVSRTTSGTTYSTYLLQGQLQEHFSVSKWKWKYLMGVWEQMSLMKHNAKYSWKVSFIRQMGQTTLSCFCSVNEDKFKFLCFMMKYCHCLLKPSFKERFTNFSMFVLRRWSKYG